MMWASLGFTALKDLEHHLSFWTLRRGLTATAAEVELTGFASKSSNFITWWDTAEGSLEIDRRSKSGEITI